MKRLILLLMACACIRTANAQVLISLLLGDKLNSGKIEFGLDGGLSLSNIGGLDGTKNRSGLNMGFYFDFKTKNPSWMISTGVIVKGPMGAKSLPVYSLKDPGLDSIFKSGSVNTKLGYFYVPVAMKYTFRNSIYLRGGVQIGVKKSATDEFVNSIASDDDIVHTVKRKQDYVALDGGLTFGIGYRLMKGYGMNLGINYYYGLLDVEVDDTKPNQFNRALYFNVGIPIGKGKAEKKKAQKESGNN